MAEDKINSVGPIAFPKCPQQQRGRKKLPPPMGQLAIPKQKCPVFSGAGESALVLLSSLPVVRQLPLVGGSAVLFPPLFLPGPFVTLCWVVLLLFIPWPLERPMFFLPHSSAAGNPPFSCHIFRLGHFGEDGQKNPSKPLNRIGQKLIEEKGRGRGEDWGKGKARKMSTIG